MTTFEQEHKKFSDDIIFALDNIIFKSTGAVSAPIAAYLIYLMQKESQKGWDWNLIKKNLYEVHR